MVLLAAAACSSARAAPDPTARAAGIGPPELTRTEAAGAAFTSFPEGAPVEPGVAEFVGACDKPCNPPTQIPELNKRFELKGNVASINSEVKLGIEIRTAPNDIPASTTCEGGGETNVFMYGLLKFLGREYGVSGSANLKVKTCSAGVCISDGLGCLGGECDSAEANLSASEYWGIELKANLLKGLGGVGAQIAKFASVEGKLTGRAGLAYRGAAMYQRGNPDPMIGPGDKGMVVSRCTNCCESGREAGYIEGGPQGLVEGKGAIALRLWKFEFEAAVGLKACGSVAGRAGVDCDGQPYAAPEVYGYMAACIESMSAISAGPVQFRELNNEASICLPTGFWDFCTTFDRCVKVGDPSRACPSGSPNPE